MVSGTKAVQETTRERKTQTDEVTSGGVQETSVDKEPRREVRRGRGGQQQGTRSFAPSGKIESFSFKLNYIISNYAIMVLFL